MPMIESAPDAVSKVYAQSVFSLVVSEGSEAVEGLLGELEEILELARSDKRFGEFLSSRIIPSEKRGEALGRILKGRVSELVWSFLQVLNEKGRLASLPSIVASLDRMVQDSFGRVEVDVYTAQAMSRDELEGVTSRLRQVMGRDPIVYPHTDDAMIGGIKVQIGDRMIDASLATQLRRMRERVFASGQAQVRSEFERLVEGG